MPNRIMRIAKEKRAVALDMRYEPIGELWVKLID